MKCCNNNIKKEKKGEGRFLSGVLYGLVPHTFCILFIVFTILGLTTATTFLKPLLLNHYFFYFLIALSLFFVTMAAIIYLKKNGILSLQGFKKKWKYLSMLYGITVSANLILFMVIFPIAANFDSGLSFTAAISSSFGERVQEKNSQSYLTLEVEIPCPGHALLITEELEIITGVENVSFRFPNKFDVNYNLTQTSKKEILSLNVFDTYKATVIEDRQKNNQSNNL